jgi:hypothetical protein
MRNAHNILVGKPFKSLGVDRIILKWVLRK